MREVARKNASIIFPEGTLRIVQLKVMYLLLSILDGRVSFHFVL
jgi:hypothetical protein